MDFLIKRKNMRSTPYYPARVLACIDNIRYCPLILTIQIKHACSAIRTQPTKVFVVSKDTISAQLVRGVSFEDNKIFGWLGSSSVADIFDSNDQDQKTILSIVKTS